MTLIFSSIVTIPKGASIKPPSLIHHNIIQWNNNIYVFNGKVVNSKAEDKLEEGKLEDRMYKISLHQPENEQIHKPQVRVWTLCGTDNVNYPSPRVGASTILREDEMIMFGGMDANGSLLNDLWRFNFKKELWSSFSNVTGNIGARAFHSVVYDPIEDVMLILFGRAKNGPSSEVYKFSFQTNAWKILPTLGKRPSERELCAVTLDETGKFIYIYGGSTSIGKDDTLFKLNMESKVWTEINPVLPNKLEFTSENDTQSPLILDAEGHPITRHTSPPKLQGHVLFCDKDLIILHGGSFTNHTMYTFSIKDAIWRRVPIHGSKFHGRQFHSVTRLNNGRFIFYGGVGEDMSQPRERRMCASNLLEDIRFYHFKNHDIDQNINILNKMRMNDELIDLIVTVGGSAFPCHSILLQRSPKLKALIQEASRKQDTKIITLYLTGVTPQVFTEILSWLYQYKLESLTHLLELSRTAMDYSIYDLVLYCVDQFREMINSKNIIQHYIETDKKKNLVLKQVCQTFIYENFTSIISDSSNVQMLSQVQNLLQEVMLLSRESKPLDIIEKFPELQIPFKDGKKMFELYIRDLWRSNTGDTKVVGPDGRSFKIHAPLFACQSPVFLQDLQSKPRSIVKINVNGDIIEYLLEYVYTGTISSSNFSLGLLSEIIKVAKEWVPALEDWAILQLIQRMSPENIVPILHICRELNQQGNITALKQFCQKEFVDKFTLEELAEIFVNLF